MAGLTDTLAAQSAEKQAILGLWVLSGLLVLVSFLLPSTVGTALTGRGVIILSITFIGSGLVYLALIPVNPESASAA